jgi:M6 family metalloprotease-like protein
VYFGTPVADAKGLWPHAGFVGEMMDSVILVRYQMTNLTDNFSLGTFVHENGHMIFGWPDLYYFGDYCMMGTGSSESPHNPVPPNDLFRADQGWIPYKNMGGTVWSAETSKTSQG